MRKLLFILMLVSLTFTLSAEGLKLKPGDRLAIVGDSITEQKLYSKFMEDYITACYPELKIDVVQLGWSGEVARSFFRRMKKDLTPFNPTVVTLFYGMNDGGYGAFKASIGETYEDSMSKIAEGVIKDNKAKLLIGSPGNVDTNTWKGDAKVYNETLGKLSEICSKIAAKNGASFTDVHTILGKTMKNAKAKLGNTYAVCGADGVHPGPNGHLVIAYSFLKGLGFDGNIGELTIDMNGKATASQGHKVISSGKGSAEFESSKYPFCFFGDETSAAGNRSILPFIPFNEELNRFKLVVTNLEWKTAKVAWGKNEKTFTKEQLEKGINLAAEFIDNPFSGKFKEIDASVASKQAYETMVIKNFKDMLPDELKVKSLLEKPNAEVEAIRKEKFEAQKQNCEGIREKVVPVKHTITITKGE